MNKCTVGMTIHFAKEGELNIKMGYCIKFGVNINLETQDFFFLVVVTVSKFPNILNFFIYGMFYCVLCA